MDDNPSEATEPPQQSAKALPAPKAANPKPSKAKPIPDSANPKPSNAEPIPESTNPEPSKAEPIPESTNPKASKAKPISGDVFFEEDDPLSREDQMKAKETMQDQEAPATEAGLDTQHKRGPGRPPKIGRGKRKAEAKATAETTTDVKLPKSKAKANAEVKGVPEAKTPATKPAPKGKAKAKAKAKPEETSNAEAAGSKRKKVQDNPEDSKPPRKAKADAKADDKDNHEDSKPPRKADAKADDKDPKGPKKTFAGRRAPKMDCYALQRFNAIRDAFMLIVKPKVRFHAKLEAWTGFSVYTRLCEALQPEHTHIFDLQDAFWQLAFENLQGVDGVGLEKVAKKSAEDFLTHEIVQGDLAQYRCIHTYPRHIYMYMISLPDSLSLTL